MGYSILIRTLGKAGIKYAQMLECIDKLNRRPDEVIVAIPHGYDLPNERLGYERFVRTDKGMVRQRAQGINFVQSEYVLLLDDDLYFDSDFVDRLNTPIELGIADVSIPPLPELLPCGRGAIHSCIAGSAVPMLLNKKDYFLRILRSGGYSYNRNAANSDKGYYYAETAPGACAYLSVNTFRSIRFEEEDWLEKYGYAMGEDQVFFYKLFLCGYRTVCVAGAKMVHLDAVTSTGGNIEKAAFGAGWFKVIFWRRFIFDVEKNYFLRIADWMCFCYCMYSNISVSRIKALFSLSKKQYLTSLLSGKRAANEFLKSDEYYSIKNELREMLK